MRNVLIRSKENWHEAFGHRVLGVVEDAGNYWRVQAGIAFDTRNLEAEAWYIDYMLHFADPIQETSERELAELLQQGLRDGWSVPEMQKTMTQLFNGWISGDVDADFAGARLPSWRSEMIARTETTRATSTGSRQLYKKAGIEHKEWLSTSDARTRDSHRAADGQVRGIDEPFMVGGYSMLNPGDSSQGAPASEIVNCRCTVLPVFDDPNDTDASLNEVINVSAPDDEALGIVDGAGLNRNGQMFSTDLPTKEEWEATIGNAANRIGMTYDTFFEAAREYSGFYYSETREAQMFANAYPGSKMKEEMEGHFQRALKIEKGLLEMPVYEGALWRQLRLDSLDAFAGGKLAPNEIIQNLAVSSYTNSLESRFLEINNPYTYIHVRNNLTGVSVENIARYPVEREVLVSGGGTYRVVSVTLRKDLPTTHPLYNAAEDGGWYIDVEEIDP